MFIDKVVKNVFGKDLLFQVETLKPSTYYVIDIKWHSGNCVHRAIMSTGFSAGASNTNPPDYCDIWSDTYEGAKQIIRIKDLYWFRVVCEIPEIKSDKRIKVF